MAINKASLNQTEIMAIHFIIFSCLVLFLLLWCKFFFENFKEDEHPYIKLFVCIICVCLFKYDWGFHFLGLEYEDAYSFSAYTRQLFYGIFSDSLRIQCVDIGSLNDPQSLGTYGGHYVTYPIFLYLFTSIFGFSFTSISLINSFISFLSLLTLAFYRYGNRYGWVVSISVFCFAPAINLFSTCFLSETFSAFLSLCFVLGFFKYKDNNSALVKTYLFVTFLLCILTKRDNAILLLVPLIFSLIEINRKNFKIIFGYLVPYCSILVISSIFIHNLFLAEFEESNDIAQSTFSFSIFISQFPVYIKSLFSIPYFTVSIILFAVFFIYNIINRVFNIRMTVLAFLLFAYLIMYSSHYRGYFFIENLESFNEFATFRYINNFFWIIPVYIALSFQALNKHKVFTYCFCVVFGLISTYLTLILRINNNHEEYSLRFNDVELLSQDISCEDVIITDVPLVYLNIVSPDTYICNIQRIHNINFNSPHKFYILAEDLSLLDKRYNLNLTKIDKQLVREFPSKKKLYLVNGVAAPPPRFRERSL